MGFFPHSVCLSRCCQKKNCHQILQRSENCHLCFEVDSFFEYCPLYSLMHFCLLSHYSYLQGRHFLLFVDLPGLDHLTGELFSILKLGCSSAANNKPQKILLEMKTKRKQQRT